MPTQKQALERTQGLVFYFLALGGKGSFLI